jgi:ATP-dependent exoDNAse (exonuclease V) beta subunit
MAKALRDLVVDWSELCELNGSSIKWNKEKLCELIDRIDLDPAWKSFLEGRGKKNVQFTYDAWRQFSKAVKQGKRFCALPPRAREGGKHFTDWYNEARDKVASCLMEGLMLAAMEEARLRQEYDFRSGSYGYNGQIVLAYRLLKFKDVRDVVQSRGHRVILDEAQDTDPLQFKLLMEITRPVGCAPYDWPSSGGEGPLMGHFCMVGDKQQAIYSERSRLKDYEYYHKCLTMKGVGEALTFTETYRCPKSIVCWVNDRFSKIFNGRCGQVEYVPLVAVEVEDRYEGCVEHWIVDGECEETQRCDYSKAAEGCIQRIAELGCKGLGIESWSEVAILAPRKDWLECLSRAALKWGIPIVQGFDSDNIKRIEWRWLAAVLSMDEDPNDEFEVAGVLREILGYSDEQIYRYKFPDDGRVVNLELSEETSEEQIGSALNHLWKVRQVSKHLGLGAKVELWCEALSLKDRLMALDRAGAEALDDLLMQAWEYERIGWSASDWLKKMRSELGGKSLRSLSSRGKGIELLTMQKAKGLEWEVVILPFLWKKIGSPSPSYPNAVVSWQEGKARVIAALNPDFMSMKYADWITENQAEKMRELRRYYYVASTRAKQRLIWVEERCSRDLAWDSSLGMACIASDEEAYEYKQQQARKWVMHLGDGKTEENSTAKTGEKSNDEDSVVFVSSEEDILESEQDKIIDLHSNKAGHQLLKLASNYTVKAKEPFWIEADAVSYGVWWHQLLLGWPWSKEEQHLLNYLHKMYGLLESENLVNRAKKELQLFIEGHFYNWIKGTGVKFLQEIRFFDSKLNAERVIDFIFQDSNRDWYLVDWKTDFPEDEKYFLSNEHQQQISEYSHGIRAAGIILKRSFIYCTATGKAIEISC